MEKSNKDINENKKKEVKEEPKEAKQENPIKEEPKTEDSIKEDTNQNEEQNTAAEEPKEEVEQPKMGFNELKKKYMWQGIFFIVLAVVVLGLMTNGFSFLSGVTGKFTGSYEKVTFDIYVMSLCPYGVSSLDAVIPVAKELGDAMQLNINYIARDIGGGRYQSLHGQPEVDEDIKQLCAKQHYPDTYLDYISCQNKDYRSVAQNWQSCASGAGMDPAILNQCFSGSEGKNLLSKSIIASNAAQATGSPTIKINGEPYTGARTPSAFKRAVCRLVPDAKECKDLPECDTDAECTGNPEMVGKCIEGKCEYSPVEPFEFIVINDRTCETCDPSRIISTTMQLFQGARMKQVDVSEEEGEAMVKKFGIEVVPSFLFGREVENNPSWSNPQIVRAFIRVSEDYYKLKDEATGATYYINEDVRLAKIERMGITLGDNKPQVDLFVMSQCPYGIIAMDAIKPVFDLLGDKFELNIEYIANDNGDGTFSSMHGQPEVDEDVRQLCAAELFPKKYMEYLACQNKDYKSVAQNWESCAEEAGLDVDDLKECFEGDQGKELMAASIEKAGLFGASGSPSLFIEGEDRRDVARTPEGYKQAVCAAFDDAPEECDTVLEGATQEAPQGGC